MERIHPAIFSGPRVYFTGFDHRIVSRSRCHERLRKDIELGHFASKSSSISSHNLISPTTSIALGFLGFNPAVGLIATALAILKETPSFIFNIHNMIGSMQAFNNLSLFHNQRQKFIKNKVTSLEISDKQSLIQLVDQLTSHISQSIKI